VQQQLGEGTVLLNYLLAPSPRGMMAVYILALTRDEEMLTMGESGSFPHALIEMKSGNIVVRCHPLGLSVSALREAVAGNSLSMIETLKNDAHTLFGPIREKLARWREQGKDHLCVVPHGPLHYYPFHLLGEEEAPLAADWAVTYLPNLCMLRATPAVSDGVTAALGISWQFQNPFGLTPLPGAALEAQAIAQVTGRPAILERAATKKVFLDTLGRAARIHLATHARHRAAAPAFQSLHLAPAQGSDGELCAHEITGLDLRHVDLVTLGACETALSRFDSADNLRGLAPALLQAGVRSIIGTLWPAPDEPARTFFAAFYQGLQNGRPKAYAFHDAQLQTRDAFPDYRDWGGFYFMGEAG
jgi:CHAT domain-containing protein